MQHQAIILDMLSLYMVLILLSVPYILVLLVSYDIETLPVFYLMYLVKYNLGAAYLFATNDGGPTWTELAKLNPHGMYDAYNQLFPQPKIMCAIIQMVKLVINSAFQSH